MNSTSSVSYPLATRLNGLSPGYLQGWMTDIDPLVREHSLNQGMLFFS